jgi:hypothetical protein
VVSRMRQMEMAAMAEAPVGYHRLPTGHAIGNLKYSHGRTGVLWQGRLRAVGTVYNSAGYAAVVHNGYAGKIIPRPKFVIPRLNWIHYTNGGGGTEKKMGKSGFVHWTNPVNGQRGNDWLDRACSKIARLDA